VGVVLRNLNLKKTQVRQEAVHFLAIYCSFGMKPTVIELYTMILMIILIPIVIICMLEYGKAIQQKRVRLLI